MLSKQINKELTKLTKVGGFCCRNTHREQFGNSDGMLRALIAHINI